MNGGGAKTAAPALAKLQQAFQSYVLGGRATAIGQEVAAPPGGDAASRLAVYRDGYALRLIEALHSDYPVLLAMTGEDRFDELARGYVRTHRSRHPNLRWYGADFSRYLGSRADRQQDLVEMAAWEWALGLAFDAADTPTVDATALAGVAPEQWPAIEMTFHPSVRRLDLRTDSPDAWKRHQEGDPTAPKEGSGDTYWLVWRQALDVRYRSLEAAEAWALDAALARADFATLCSGLLRWKDDDSVAVVLVGFLHAWLRDGLICAILAE